MIEAHDQIVSAGAAINETTPLRIGLSKFYAEAVVSAYDRGIHGELIIVVDNSPAVMQDVSDGNVDIACVVNPLSDLGHLVLGWKEQFVWSSGRAFALDAGKALPLVGWLGLVSHEIAIQALEDGGVAYRVVYSDSDYHNRVKAVESGIGVMAVPAHRIVAPLVRDRKHSLPALPPVDAGIFVRHGINREIAEPVVLFLKAVMAKSRGLID